MPDFSRADAPATEAPQPPPSEALGKLRRGEMSLQEYLDICVEQAVSHLVNNAHPDRLQFVRQLLRDLLISDPVLNEYVREATASDLSAASGR